MGDPSGDNGYLNGEGKGPLFYESHCSNVVEGNFIFSVKYVSGRLPMNVTILYVDKQGSSARTIEITKKITE